MEAEEDPKQIQWEDEYNFDEAAEDVAKKRGLIVVKPNDDQLQIDIDSEEQLNEFWRRFNCFIQVCPNDFCFNGGSKIKVQPSPSGKPGRFHITITVKGKVFSAMERIAYQAALNDDPLRVFLNMRRVYAGVEDPTRLFEKPEIEHSPLPKKSDDLIPW